MTLPRTVSARSQRPRHQRGHPNRRAAFRRHPRPRAALRAARLPAAAPRLHQPGPARPDRPAARQRPRPTDRRSDDLRPAPAARTRADHPTTRHPPLPRHRHRAAPRDVPHPHPRPAATHRPGRSQVLVVGGRSVPGCLHEPAEHASSLRHLVLATAVVQQISVELARAKGLVPGAFRFGQKVTSTL